MSKKIAVGTTGPFQLLCALAVLEAQGLLQKFDVAIFHYEHSTDAIIKCEKWIASIFGVDYVTHLGRIQAAALKLLEQQSRFDRLFKAHQFLKTWCEWGNQKLYPIDCYQVEHLILPFRPQLSDVLLVNLFPNAKCAFVADGLLMGYATQVAIPTSWKMRNFTNPFSHDSSQEIWAPKGLEKAIEQFGNVCQIDSAGLKQTIRQIVDHHDYQTWIAGLKPKKTTSYSCLLLQNLQGKWMDSFEEVSLYAEIISDELRQTSSTILVKPHPRDNLAKLRLLNLLIPEKDRERVVFLDFSVQSTAPIEILLEALPITKLLGLCSSALLTAANWSNIEVCLYTNEGLPQALRLEIERCKQAGNFTLHYL